MDREPSIVPGEASESDDEDFVIEKAAASNVRGKAIIGEAPESDSSQSEVDETGPGLKDGSVGSVSSAASVLSLLSPTSDTAKTSTLSVKDDSQYCSLLHKKLRERNASLRRSVDDFIHTTVGTAARDLNSIDQHLLKSQVTLQEAATSLRLLQSNLSQIHSKLSVITSTYFPVINVHNL